MSEGGIHKAGTPEARDPIIVFAGPCLPEGPDPRWRSALEGCEIWPPAQRGDVLRALGERPSALVLLDGLYYSVPSVTHKELLYALGSEVTVVGAASMGALRAVEMAPFGMIGVGRVFELFRDGVLDGDDEVAILHASGEHDYRPLTLALVEVRHALAECLRRRTLPAEMGDAFLAAAKELPFTERSRRRLAELAAEHLDSEIAQEIFRCVAAEGLKRADALRALEWAQRHRRLEPEDGASGIPGIEFDSEMPPDESGSGSRKARRRREAGHLQARAGACPLPDGATSSSSREGGPLVTTLVNHFREWYLGPIRPTRGEREPPTYLQAWQVAQLFHPAAADFVAALRRRFLLASAAREAGVDPAEELQEEILETFRSHLAADDCPLPAFEVSEEARLQALAEAGLGAFEGGGEDSVEAAGRVLAPRFGLGAEVAGRRILDLLAVQGDLLPPWLLTRSFLFTSALSPALALAESAFQVHRAFRSWTRGVRLSRAEAVRVVAATLGCGEEHAEPEAARRGLFTGGSTDNEAPGTLRSAAELVAAAQRLAEPVNDYPERRKELRRASLSYARPLPAGREASGSSSALESSSGARGPTR